MKKILSLLKVKNKKYLIILSFVLFAFLGIFFTTIFSSKENTITYKQVKTIIKNKEDVVIYYYNSKSNNFNNWKVKRYLNKEGIRYYTYNDKNVDKKEYNQLLNLLKIDSKVFGCPSLIYIKEGKMYGNIINIDNTKVVKQFIDNYDLYTIK